MAVELYIIILLHGIQLLGDLIIPVDALSIILDVGLIVYHPKSWSEIAWVAVGAMAQWSEHLALQLKQEVLNSILGGCPGFFYHPG